MPRNVTYESRTACSQSRSTGGRGVSTSIFVSIGEPRRAASVSITQVCPALAWKRNKIDVGRRTPSEHNPAVATPGAVIGVACGGKIVRLCFQ